MDNLVEPFIENIKQWYNEDYRITNLKRSIDRTLAWLEPGTQHEDIEPLLDFSRLLGEIICDESDKCLARRQKIAQAELLLETEIKQ